MVACENVNLNAAVRQFGQLSEQADVPLWHHVLVLKPKVKDVTQQENMRSIGAY
ncbi:hypothetical protein D3C83_300760 [compost metagenome]